MDHSNENVPKKKYKRYTDDKAIPRTTLWRRFLHVEEIDAGNIESESTPHASVADSESVATFLSPAVQDTANTPAVSSASDLDMISSTADVISTKHADEVTDRLSMDYSASSDEDTTNSEQAANISGSENHLSEESRGEFESDLSSHSDTGEQSSPSSGHDAIEEVVLPDFALHESEEFSTDEDAIEEDSIDEEDRNALEGRGVQEVHADEPELAIFNANLLQTPIQAVTDFTLGEGVIMAMTLANRHHLTDIMEMFNTILGQDVLPSSSHCLRNTFKIPLDNVKYFVYCVECGYCVDSVTRHQRPVREVLCPNEHCRKACKLSLTEGNFFVILDCQTQIKYLFENNPEVTKLVLDRNLQPAEFDGVIRGVEDSFLHRTLFEKNKELDRARDFTYNFNIDGAKMFNTTKMSLYPIQLLINELPPSVRSKNVVLAGLWYGKGPVMETFLEPFVEEAMKLNEVGVTWKMENNHRVTSKLTPLCACVDSVARPQLQNHVQFNGYNGCSWCYHRGHVFPGTKTMKYPFSENQRYREIREVERDMEVALGKKGGENGILGPTPLLLLPHFDYVWGYPVDYLHGVLLGTVSSILEYTLTHTNAVYYLGRPKTLRNINARLTSIKPPNIVHHLPQSLSDRGQWKATDYKSWLLWYAVPCLHDVWHQDHLSHFACLVEGITLLLKMEISPTDIAKADELLTRFVKKAEKLYSSSAMTYNLHTLLHYAKCVQMCGPLWSSSTFPFESQMHIYKRKLTGSKGVAIQITERILRSAYLPALEHVVTPSDKVKSFLETHGDSKRRFQKCVVLNNSMLIGNGLLRKLKETEAELLGVPEACEYMKIIHNGLVINSVRYRRSQKRCNSTVRLKSDDIGELQGIFVTDKIDGTQMCWYIVKIFKKQQMKCGNVLLSHIWKCDTSGDDTRLIAVQPDEVAETCILINFPRANKTFVSVLPNTIEVQ